MPHDVPTVIEDFYAGWNRHDAAAIAASFAMNGVYSDPFTRIDLSGDNLTDHVQSVLDVIHGLQITVLRIIGNEEAAAATWTIEGTWEASWDRSPPRKRLRVSRGPMSSSSKTVVCSASSAHSISSP